LGDKRFGSAVDRYDRIALVALSRACAVIAALSRSDSRHVSCAKAITRHNSAQPGVRTPASALALRLAGFKSTGHCCVDMILHGRAVRFKMGWPDACRIPAVYALIVNLRRAAFSDSGDRHTVQSATPRCR
jgi:hypothetical protein